MIIVYSKPDCPYCVKAKEWLDKHEFSYREVDISADDEARDFIKARHTTVPQIYWNNMLLVSGGATALTAMTPDALAERIAMTVAKSG